MTALPSGSNVARQAPDDVETPLRLQPSVFRRDVWAAEARYRLHLFVSLAVLLLGWVPVDAYIVGRFDPRLVLVRLLWTASFVVAAVVTRTYGSSVTAPVDLGIAMTCSVGMVVVVALTGASRSPLLAWCLVLPVAVSHVVRRRIRESLLSSLICGVGALVVVWTGHPERRTLVAWGLLTFTTAFVAIVSSRLQVRVSKAVDKLAHSRQQLAQQRAKIERERTDARRLALVGQMAAGVAHEVNNPLAVVKAHLGLILSEVQMLGEGPGRDALLESVGEAATGVERIRVLVRELAELPARDSEVVEECEPEELVSDVVHFIRASTSTTVVAQADPGLPTVRVGRRQAVQTLKSLLHNAVEAVERQPPGEVRLVVLRACGDKDEVRFEVEDTGAGVPAEVFPRLFEPFFTTKPIGKGKGLNLARAREQIAQAGGSISAENLPTGGARFTVRLPVQAGA